MREILSEIEQRMDQPTARGLANAVSRTIRDGVLVPGTKLPPIRRVASELALSPTTVTAAWRLLARSGAIHGAGRRGTTVGETAAPGAVRYRQAVSRGTSFAVDLSTGVPDAALLPNLANSFVDLTTAGTPSSYLDAPVLPELEAELRRSWPYPADQITVVDGALDALDQVARSILRFGDRVVVEHPCFPPLVDLMEAAGVEVVGVPLDAEGMSLERLAEALETSTRAIFLQPRAQNPTGVSMTRERARSLARVIEGSRALVVEDDSTGAIGVSEPLSLGEWLPDQTVHIRSFSKSHGPDLRLAAMSAPAELMTDLLARRQLGQGWSSRLLQRILLHLLTDPVAIAEVEKARSVYAGRRRVLVEELAKRGVEVGGSDGINLWIPVQDEASALIRLASQGIGVAPGKPFAVLPETCGFMRVTVGLVSSGNDWLAGALAEAVDITTWGSVAR
ncbi:MAG: aminotransferase-like domain-containing protein [Dermatophilaceae bacterium]